MTDIFALAYIDPGSGTVLLQILLSGFFAGVLLFRNTVRSLFCLRSRREKHVANVDEMCAAPQENGTERPVTHKDTDNERAHVMH